MAESLSRPCLLLMRRSFSADPAGRPAGVQPVGQRSNPDEVYMEQSDQAVRDARGLAVEAAIYEKTLLMRLSKSVQESQQLKAWLNN